MDITLDIPLIRSILDEESTRARDEISARGAGPALVASLARQDLRIAAAPDSGTLACRAGCAWCCHFTVDVRPVEVFAIIDYVEQELPAAEQARVRAQVEANSGLLRGLDDDARVTRNLRCPFLGDGRCIIYPARPQSCRNYHATDAAGCRQSFEEPENLDIDPEFAPGVYQAGGAHVEAFSLAMADAGYDVKAYELNSALHAAWSDPASRMRFAARDEPFAGLAGEEVFAEYDDLD